MQADCGSKKILLRTTANDETIWLNQHHPSEYQYLDLMEDIMKHGKWKVSHSTGVKLKSVFGRICRYDLSKASRSY